MNHTRAVFNSRRQRPQEAIIAFLDDLEITRLREFLRELRDERKHKIVLKFRNGVSDPGLHNMLLFICSEEEFAMHPPIVEQSRHLANMVLRYQVASRAVDYRGIQTRSNFD